jgi:Protein of unknown function (DUF1572)
LRIRYPKEQSQHLLSLKSKLSQNNSVQYKMEGKKKLDQSSETIESIQAIFRYYKSLGEGAMKQVAEEDLFKQANPESNSVAIIVKHLWGNMLSRWTDFLNSDGEKSWRMRDEEFINDFRNREELLLKWEEGWSCLFAALSDLSDSSLNQIVYIRNQGHTVLEALQRQLGHYAYHIGQIVFVSKMLSNEWETLSIARGKSTVFNDEKFAKTPHIEHFTDDLDENH